MNAIFKYFLMFELSLNISIAVTFIFNFNDFDKILVQIKDN